MHNVEAGERLFVHRRSKIHLYTRTTIQISHDGEWPDAPLGSFSVHDALLSWFPRSRNLPLLLRASFAEDLDPRLIISKVSLIADHIAEAELGYDVSHVQLDGEQVTASERTIDMDFSLKSISDDGPSALCPEGISSVYVQLVRLHLRFVTGDDTNAGPNIINQAIGIRDDHRLSKVPLSTFLDTAGGFPLLSELEAGHQRRLIQQSESQNGMHELATSLGEVRLKQKPPKMLLLEEEVFLALLDIGVRSSIASRPTKTPPGVQSFTEPELISLSDICPASFAQQYAQRFDEQSRYIPAVSRWLAPFSLRSTRNGNGSTGPHLEKNLWRTVANGVRDPQRARRLQPLWSWSSKKGNDSTKRPKYKDIACLAATLEDRRMSNDCGDPSQAEDVIYGDIDNEDLFNFDADFNQQAKYCTSITRKATSGGANGCQSATVSDLGDVNVGFEGHEPVDIRNSSFGASDSAGPHHQDDSHAASPSQISDVSMLLPLNGPMERSRITEDSDVIGGSSWLTQNVIRMHPLRQHGRQDYLVEELDHDHGGKGLGPYEKDHARWSEHELDVLSLGKEELLPRPYTFCQPAHTKSYSNNLCETDLLQVYHDLRHSQSENILSGHWPVPMSEDLKQSPSNTSLADVLGNDHLLWHMWKRRASVAPRGEEDVLDMKMMYQTDPDMKLFGQGWDLDPSDMSSGSNGDRMLHDTVVNHLAPREKHDTPMTPPSERRSYFSAHRSSSASSSSYVGRSNSDPKPQRRPSIMKRLSWGGRPHTSDMSGLDMTKLNGRTMEVKRRKTMDDYEMRDREALEDDSNEMLF
ncbi:hypothetical protein LTR47_007189 [Exophiala xenobiotica]|nr:hypothetical protein LTR47_007189 [Exophiala xenobiotica]KAK5248932.1 hypothetical protein LTS06_006117 [Exophiala xenobiotica]KAK5348184.1 hypothetical protein LTR61_008042 [Exophiala xenobiotica]KAK5365204.1 hypothetical protein LTR11_008614 [Exophiala xenobiotica]KAK5365989.1 hypothetical protein LTS03_008748 [Exophiala xenobiotica]